MITIGCKDYPFDGILFLDMDGVLNSQDWFVKTRKIQTGYVKERIDGESDAVWYARTHIDPTAVEYLNYFLAHANFAIVISSTWRSCDWTRDAIALAGIDQYKNRLLGYTPKNGGDRGNEIQQWMDKYTYRGPFIAFDDDGDMVHLMPRLVRTYAAHGLTPFIVHLALDKLRKDENIG